LHAGIAVLPDGASVYFSEAFNDNVWKLNGGTATIFVAAASITSTPTGLAVNSAGLLYVAGKLLLQSIYTVDILLLLGTQGALLVGVGTGFDRITLPP
jgi:DNA-binding beta-propeller fold protein YncE